MPDYLANFSVNSYLQMFCLFHLAQGWHQAGVQRAAIIWQIFFLAIIIFKCSVCTMLASGRCTEGSDYLAIRHTSPHSPPLSMSKYPFNHILHTIINYSKTMWVQNITAAIMMLGGISSIQMYRIQHLLSNYFSAIKHRNKQTNKPTRKQANKHWNRIMSK